MLDASNSELKQPSRAQSIHKISSRNTSISAPNDLIISRDNSVEHLTDRDVHTSAGNADDSDTKPPPSKRLKSSSSATGGSKPTSTAGPIKPKSKAPRPRSPSPTPPPPPPPPLQTIRLQIKLGGPDNYEVHIATLAKTTGQRQPTPQPPKADTSESEGEGEGEGEGEDDNDAQDKPKKKKVIHTQHGIRSNN
jgi:hypothetical protein